MKIRHFALKTTPYATAAFSNDYLVTMATRPIMHHIVYHQHDNLSQTKVGHSDNTNSNKNLLGNGVYYFILLYK